MQFEVFKSSRLERLQERWILCSRFILDVLADLPSIRAKVAIADLDDQSNGFLTLDNRDLHFLESADADVIAALEESRTN